MRRLTRSALALAICALVVPVNGAQGAPPPGDDLVACRSEGQVEVFKGSRWLKVKAPKVVSGEGPSRIVDFDAARNNPNWLYATNGTVIRASGDAGCTWDFVFRGTSAARMPAGSLDNFTTIAASGDNDLWAASYDDTEAAPTPHAYQITNTGEGATTDPNGVTTDTGLPKYGTPYDIAVSGGDNDAAFLLVDELPDVAGGDIDRAARHLYATYRREDPEELRLLGLAWKEIAPPAGFGRIEGMTPTGDPKTLWIWSGTKWARTTDIQADQVKWDTGTATDPIVGIELSPFGVPAIVSAGSQGGTAELLDDGLKVGKALPLPVKPASFSLGVVPGAAVVHGEGRTWGYDTVLGRWVDITPKGRPEFTDLKFTNGLQTRIILGQREDSFYRYDTYPVERFVKPADPEGFGRGYIPPKSNLTGPTLVPVTHTVTLEPGVEQRVPIDFGVPPTPTKLDVFFLMDTTGSMGPSIKGLLESIESIALELRHNLGKTACFGVGDFKDFDPDSAVLDTANTFRTHQKIVCEAEDVPLIKKAITQMKATGGGDPPEAQTIALEQMLTGAGQASPPVLPNEDAEFRTDAFKVAVLITDERFKQGAGYPSMDSVIERLNANDVKVVNILALTSGDLAGAREDMSTLAYGTRSLAPAGGIDCDGDGAIGPFDVRAGMPMICEAGGAEAQIGPAITSLLLGVQDPGTLAVEVIDPHKVVHRPIVGATSKIMNLKYESHIGFVLPVACTAKQDGMDLPVTLLPSVRAQPTGIVGQVVVRCRGKAEPPPPPPPQPRVEVPVDPPPPPQKPPVAIGLPPPPNPPAQPISNMNLNAGFSQQEEQQFQLAAVTQGASEESEEAEEVELAMSAVPADRYGPAAAVGLIAGAAVLSAGAALAHRRRLQRSLRGVRVRV